MNIWMFIWLVLSVGLLGFSAWNWLILSQQKREWRRFAKENRLRYRAKAMMMSPEVSGTYKDHGVNIFTSEFQLSEGRGGRKMTAVEIEMDSRMPIAGALGSKGMVEVIQSLDFSDSFQPKLEGWDTENIIRCDDKKVMEAYFTKERLDALQKFLQDSNIWLLLVFRGNEMILRIDTPKALQQSGELQGVVDRLIEAAQVLELKKGEDKNLMTYKTQRDAERNRRVDLDDSDLGDDLGFELEEDDEAVAELSSEGENAAFSDVVDETVKNESSKKVEEMPKKRKPKPKAAQKKSS